MYRSIINILMLVSSMYLFSMCASSYDRWYAKYPGMGTYRIIEEKFEPDIKDGQGRLKGCIYDAVDKKELSSSIEIMDKDTVIKLNSDGSIKIDLNEGLYTLIIKSVGHHDLVTKNIQVREKYETNLEFYIGAEY